MQSIFGTVELFCMILHVINLSILIECTISRLNLSVKYGFQVTRICQHGVINYNTCTTLMGNVNSEGGFRGMGYMGNVYTFHPVFLWTYKSSLLYIVNFKSSLCHISFPQNYIFKELIKNNVSICGTMLMCLQQINIRWLHDLN